MIRHTLLPALLMLCSLCAFDTQAQNKGPLIPYRKGKLWGYCNYEGKIIISPRYERVDPDLKNPYPEVSRKLQNGKIIKNFIDKTGYELLPEKYQDAAVIKCYPYGQPLNPTDTPDFFKVTPSKLGHYALYNRKQGKVVSPFRFDDIYQVEVKGNTAVFICTDKDSACAIDENGSFKIKMIKGSIYSSRGRLEVSRGGEETSAPVLESAYEPSASSQSRVPQTADKPFEIYPGVFVRYQNGLCGLMAADRSALTPIVYDSFLRSFNGTGHILAVQNGQWGILDNSGRVWVAPAYQEITNSCPDNTVYRVKKDHKWSLFDGRARQSLTASYDYVHYCRLFDEGQALYLVRDQGKYGAIDQNGRVVVPLQYNDSLSLDHLPDSILLEESKDERVKVYFLAHPERNITGGGVGGFQEALSFTDWETGKKQHVYRVIDPQKELLYYVNAQGRKYLDGGQ